MTETKTHWKKLHNPDYLGAYALDPGQEIILTIKDVKQEVVPSPDGKKEDCMVAHFKDKDTKPMILNATNAKIIEKMYKTPYIEDWADKKIQVYVDKVKAFGELWDALRIRPKIPQAKKEAMTPNHARWKGAVQSVKDGTGSIEMIREYFELSAENEKKLLEAAGKEQANA